MTHLRPFPGLRYDPRLVGGVGDIICPPYDIISPELQQALHDRSPYNMVHLEYGLELPGDSLAEDKYSRAAATLRNWLEQGILKAEDRPALYLHQHSFTYEGQRHQRGGFLASIHLYDWGQEIRPHEYTMAAPKRDRLSLMHACRANLSPVFALYEDPDGTVSSLQAQIESQRPTVESGDDFQGDSHRLWAITEPEAIHRLVESLRPQPLYIADGHHRYETARAYQRDQLQSHPRGSGEEAFNFVLANLVAFTDPGLVLRPTHRLVKGISSHSLDGLSEALNRFFELEELSIDSPLPPGEAVIEVVGLKPQCLVLLHRREHVSYDHTPLQGRSVGYSGLGVCLLEHLIIEGWLQAGTGAKEIEIAYTSDDQMARRKVAEAEYQLAFLLNPIRVEAIKLVADAGERLPRKSTYFYPKPPAGLVIHSLSG